MRLFFLGLLPATERKAVLEGYARSFHAMLQRLGEDAHSANMDQSEAFSAILSEFLGANA